MRPREAWFGVIEWNTTAIICGRTTSRERRAHEDLSLIVDQDRPEDQTEGRRLR